MKTLHRAFTLLAISFFISCGNSKAKDFAALVQEVNLNAKPDNCLLFFKSIELSNMCLSNKEFDINVHTETTNACSIDIQFTGSNNSNFDIEIYYEMDSENMEHFNILTEGQRGSLIPETESRDIDDLGDMAFISIRPILNQKILVTTRNNVRVMISVALNDKINNCMYGDGQLEKLARAILENIS